MQQLGGTLLPVHMMPMALLWRKVLAVENSADGLMVLRGLMVLVMVLMGR